MPFVVYVLPGNMRWKPSSAAAILTGFFEATMISFDDAMVCVVVDSMAVRFEAVSSEFVKK